MDGRSGKAVKFDVTTVIGLPFLLPSILHVFRALQNGRTGCELTPDHISPFRFLPSHVNFLSLKAL